MVEVDANRVAVGTFSKDEVVIDGRLNAQTDCLEVLKTAYGPWLLRGSKIFDKNPEKNETASSEKVPMDADIEKALTAFARKGKYMEEALSACLDDFRNWKLKNVPGG